MSAVATKRGSPQVGNPGSRTSSPIDSSSNNSSNSNSDVAKNEETQNTQAEAKDKPAGEVENGSRRIPQTTDTEADYFSGVHHFSLEPNPFEQSFSNTATTAETPGKSLLPPVATLTSPALPGTSNTNFNWTNSLRAGPLSPAMLAGPAGANDYFDNIGRGFPTPNESSMRTGLTPGGGGSMFPVPSPSGQAVFSHLQSGGATPSTLEFQRTAVNAARKGGPTSNPQEQPDQLLQQANIEIPKSGPPMDPYAHPDATDAANGLFMLAKGAQASNTQFMPPTSQPMQAQIREPYSGNGSPMNSDMQGMQNGENQGISVNGNMSDDVDQAKTTVRGKGKKANAKSTTSTNGRRKADDSSKSSNKRQKGANGGAVSDRESDQDMKASESTGNSNSSKKLTDEEKRKNFLERNRVAALKCRQRKKQWLNNLQTKVEVYSSENEALNATVGKLRDEIVHLKQILLAHKDCPLAQAQGVGNFIVNNLNSVNGVNGMGEYPMPPNPYSMPMQPQPNPNIPAGMQRR